MLDTTARQWARQALDNIRRGLALGAGTTTLTPLRFQSGTLNTSPVAGGEEYDGAGFYATVNTVGGRAFLPASHHFALAADGAAIGPAIADFYGANSAIQLQAAGIYQIEWEVWLTKATAGTITFTLVNTQAPVNMNAIWEGSASSINASSNMGRAGVVGSSSATQALPAGGSVADAAVVAYRVRAFIEAHATNDSNLRLQVTESAGTVTPRRGSWYRVTKIPALSVGNFAA